MMEPTPVLDGIIALVVVHNRVAMTRACLLELCSQGISERNIIVVDDGSSDDTGHALRTEFPEASVVTGDGSLYWCGAMALAESQTVTREFSHLLWVNNDIELRPGAIKELLSQSVQNPDAIVVGALRDRSTNEVTYSGYQLAAGGRGVLGMTRVAPGDVPVPIDTFNGNLVLVPQMQAAVLGGVDSRLTQHYGDFDYGLRARKRGITLILAPGTAGYTSRNSIQNTFRDSHAPRSSRVRNLFGPKGFPPQGRYRYLSRHGSAFWPLEWAGFYAYWLCRIVVGR